MLARGQEGQIRRATDRDTRSHASEGENADGRCGAGDVCCRRMVGLQCSRLQGEGTATARLDDFGGGARCLELGGEKGMCVQ
eukprot:3159111-Rhodomonas_salina.2